MRSEIEMGGGRMTLDEAIKHAEEVAKGNENLAEFYYKEPGRNTALGDDCRECAEEHRQLAEWLKDYERLTDVLDKIRAEINELKPNNPNFKGYFEQNVALNKVLDIIDKYRESEVQDADR